MNSLTSLNLKDNYIYDLSPLSSLSLLNKLDLYNTHISDVMPLSGLINLAELYLNYNNISDVTPLAGLTSLNTLDLFSNSIKVGVAELVSLVNTTSIKLALNDSIPCADLATLTNALPGVVIEPASCL